MIQQDPIAGSELRGKMIHPASIAAYRGGLPLTAPYTASKAAVVSLARTAAQAFAPHRVTSNCICPGVVQTPLWERLDAEWSAIEGWATGEAWKRRTAGIPLERPERRGRRRCASARSRGVQPLGVLRLRGDLRALGERRGRAARHDLHDPARLLELILTTRSRNDGASGRGIPRRPWVDRSPRIPRRSTAGAPRSAAGRPRPPASAASARGS